MTLSRRSFLGSLALPAFAAPPAGEQPNIVLIVADGVGAWLLGCYGNKEIRTPNIDRLATTGTRFLNHFAGAPVPAAGRAALLTNLDKAIASAGYHTQTVNGATEAVQFLDAQSAGKPFLLIAGWAPYRSAPGAKFVEQYAQAKFDTLAQEPAAKNASRNRE